MSERTPADLKATGDVLEELRVERTRQVVEHDMGREHDDRLTMTEWAWRLLRRVTDLAHPWPEAHVDVRRELVEIAAIAVAALEAHDRRQRFNRELTEAVLRVFPDGLPDGVSIEYDTRPIVVRVPVPRPVD